ncbi:hypothetical protein C8F01DRAFT_1096638 [Mycena amicta]|nr:hypothetical protein C8F01DRAFT_1096638 [Mycena amicta]
MTGQTVLPVPFSLIAVHFNTSRTGALGLIFEKNENMHYARLRRSWNGTYERPSHFVPSRPKFNPPAPPPLENDFHLRRSPSLVSTVTRPPLWSSSMSLSALFPVCDDTISNCTGHSQVLPNINSPEIVSKLSWAVDSPAHTVEKTSQSTCGAQRPPRKVQPHTRRVRLPRTGKAKRSGNDSNGDTVRVKRPPNTFLRFRTEYFKNLSPTADKELRQTRFVADLWKGLTSEERLPYETMRNQDWHNYRCLLTRSRNEDSSGDGNGLRLCIPKTKRTQTPSLGDVVLESESKQSAVDEIILNLTEEAIPGADTHCENGALNSESSTLPDYCPDRLDLGMVGLDSRCFKLKDGFWECKDGFPMLPTIGDILEFEGRSSSIFGQFAESLVKDDLSRICF